LWPLLASQVALFSLADSHRAWVAELSGVQELPNTNLQLWLKIGSKHNDLFSHSCSSFPANARRPNLRSDGG
jgi:hypothetical protein